MTRDRSLRSGCRSRPAGGVLAAVAVLGMTGLLGAASQPGALAQEEAAVSPSEFFAVGSAEGVRIAAASPGFLVVEQFADAGLPAAQALTSSTDAQGYAAAPYPGAETFGVLGTASGASGQDLNDFPLAVRTDSATPAQERTVGPVVLKSVTGASSTTSSAVGGAAVTEAGTIGSSEASARSSHAANGTSVAASASRAGSVVIGDVLRIGGVSATAEVTAPLSGALVRRSALVIGEVRVAGQAVGVTEKGLVLPGTEVALPRDSALAQALAGQGITVEYIALTTTKDGVISAGLLVEQVRSVPGLPEPVTVSYTFGRAAAFAKGGEGETSVTDEEPVLSPVDPSSAAPPGLDAGGTAASEARDSGLLAAGGAVPPLPESAGGVGSADTAAPVTAPAEGSTRAVAASSSRGALAADTSYFYLVLVAGGALLVGGVQLLRLFGVRVLWA
ncbi:MAG: hypothetical protein JWN08_1448 [Frankiales bacterium]|nr:hypothetical protein [Frankiales bacterium]